ncbi:MAG: hypothetical protein KDB70_20610 [Mycobacterium sp.]|nr:hypothetical protein [Mycobacterium sp.]
MPAEESTRFCQELAAFIEFLGETGALRNTGQKLARVACGSADLMTRRMADPANYGMAGRDSNRTVRRGCRTRNPLPR